MKRLIKPQKERTAGFYPDGPTTRKTWTQKLYNWTILTQVYFLKLWAMTFVWQRLTVINKSYYIWNFNILFYYCFRLLKAHFKIFLSLTVVELQTQNRWIYDERKTIGYQNWEVVLKYSIPDPEPKSCYQYDEHECRKICWFLFFYDFDQLRQGSDCSQNTCKQTYCVLHALPNKISFLSGE